MNKHTSISLKRRLILASAVWIAFGFLLAFYLLSAIFRTQAIEQFYEELEVHVVELERLIEESDSGIFSIAEHFSDPRYDVPLSGYYWLVRQNGRTVLRSNSLEGNDIDLPADDHPIGTSTFRIRATGPTGPLLFMEKSVRSDAEDAPIIEYLVGTDKRHLERMVAQFNRLLATTMIIFASIMIMSAGGLIHIALNPFTRLKTALARVRSGSTRTIDGEFPKEVQPLVSEFNALLIGMSDMLQRARAGAGNLAHGLKGPLTLIVNEAYELSERGNEESGRMILEQTGAMQRHIDHHLARARASVIARLPGMRTSVSAELSELVLALKKLYSDKRLSVTTTLEPSLYSSADAQDLKEIIGNVLDNAFKHAVSGIVIEAARVSDDLIDLTISDDGPGLPVKARSVVFAIGQKWDERKPGSGLGLAIVKELVDLYGGSVSLNDSHLGGLAVTISLPAAV